MAQPVGCGTAYCNIGYAPNTPYPGCEPVCYDCGINPCAFTPNGCQGSTEEPFEVKDLEVYQIEGEKVTPAIWGSAEVLVPIGTEMTITFVAKYGTFESRVFSGSKADPSRVYDKYEPPCSKDMPADGFDEAWVVVYDRANKISAESEHVKFNIEEPENVHVVHPLG